MNTSKNLKDARLMRWMAWSSAHGYAPTISARPIHSCEMNALLDHGFTARHLATGRYVVFGDPYMRPGLADEIAGIEARGIEVLRHAGLWCPDRSQLLEFWVIDPLKARDVFRTYQWANRYGYGSAPLIVDHPVRWLEDRAPGRAALRMAGGSCLVPV
jgi:hypothetical protein